MKRGVAIVLALMVSPALLAASKVNIRSEQCGVAFSLPRGWTAEEMPPHVRHGDEDESAIQCHVALRPRGWTKIAKKSRWGAADPPLVMMIFEEGTSFEDALDEVGFENDEEGGHGFGMPGGYGSFAEAQAYKAGPLSGQRAGTFFRGFIKDESLVHGEESSVFSGEIPHIVLKAPGGRVIAFECEGGTPDEHVDCDAAIEEIANTLSFKP